MKNVAIVALLVVGAMKLGFMGIDSLQGQAQSSMEAYSAKMEHVIEGK